jgi:hypothetical protein
MKHKLVSNQGNYGKVYVLESNKPFKGFKKFILKINKDEDVCLFHEYNVMKAFEKHKQLNGFFPKTFACYTRRQVDTNRKEQFLYSQYIVHEHTFENVITTLTYEQKKNIYNHLICMLKMAQELCRFTHYDLHFNNILLQRCPSEKRTYEFDGEKVTLVCIPFKPVIIDFGFSHVNEVPCYRGPLTQTHYFMNPIVYCPYFDICSLKRRMSREGLKFNELEEEIFSKKLRTSLFDFLCKLLHCSQGESCEATTQDAKHEKNWITIVKWKSARTEREDRLFQLLYGLDEEKENLDLYACAPLLDNVQVLQESNICDIIHCLIREYLKIYNRYYEDKVMLMKKSSYPLLLK